MDNFARTCKENDSLREDIPIFTLTGEYVTFESPVKGVTLKCTISREVYGFLMECFIDEQTVGNIFLLVCERLEKKSLDLRYYNCGCDRDVAIGIVVCLSMCQNNEDKFLRVLSEMSKEAVDLIFFKGQYMDFPKVKKMYTI